jgi:hypothetical protein
MSDLTLDIQPDVGGALRLCVTGERGKIVFPLLVPQLNRGMIDALRSGAASSAIAAKLSTDVSTWLLNGGFAQHLLLEINGATKATLRLVFHTDPKLLDGALADLPFELLELSEPVVLKAKVRALVHALDKIGPAPTALASTRWPLRVLIVRSNPRDLSDAVPPAAGLRDEIRKLAEPHYGPGNVEVTLLSREPGVKKPVTWRAVRDSLGSSSRPDIFIFLGHGDIVKSFDNVPGTGVLHFESPDGEAHEEISAKLIKNEFEENPVPAVILVGCLTAASPPRADFEALLPNWMRGNQAVAQALVNSESGVHIAIGMRYRLETEDAELFLKAFFRSLLQPPAPGAVDVRGDVEIAVRDGRRELYHANPYPPSWSAPVIFRTLLPEPMFPFLRTNPGAMDPVAESDQLTRESAWKMLSESPRAGRTPAIDPIVELLDRIENDTRARAAANGLALIAPTRAEVSPGTVATVAIELSENVTVESVTGRITFEAGLQVRGMRSSAALRAAGFQAMFAPPGEAELEFRLQHSGPAGQTPKALTKGPLFEFDFDIGQAVPAVHVVHVEDLAPAPPRPMRGLINAILVSPP